MAAPEQPRTYSLRSAQAADAGSVAALVDAAYGHYLERIGMLPGPMTEDYAEVIGNRQAIVAERHGAIVGSSSSPRTHGYGCAVWDPA